MNKAKLRKKIDSVYLFDLLKTSNFIGFFCVQNVDTVENIEIKKKLSAKGFEFKYISNSILFKYLAKSLPKMRNIFSGSLAVCFVKKNRVKDPSFDFISVKDIFGIVKKKKDIFFLGAFFEGNFVNCFFESKILALKDEKQISLEHVTLIQHQLTNLIQTTATPKNNLSFLLANKAKL